MKVKRFHQLTAVDRGPVNSVVLDYLKGEAYQVENRLLDAFLAGRWEEAAEFAAQLEEAGLLLEVEEGEWVPGVSVQEEDPEEAPLILDVEAGVDLGLVREWFGGWPVKVVNYYGGEVLEVIPGVETRRAVRDFEGCRRMTRVDGGFAGVDERTHFFRRKYNSCWGRRVAVTADGCVRPCINSSLSAGRLGEDSAEVLLERLAGYWGLNGDRLEKCRECEFRYICMDCRELAVREGGGLHAPNPTCGYHPLEGVWR